MVLFEFTWSSITERLPFVKKKKCLNFFFYKTYIDLKTNKKVEHNRIS